MNSCPTCGERLTVERDEASGLAGEQVVTRVDEYVVCPSGCDLEAYDLDPREIMEAERERDLGV